MARHAQDREDLLRDATALVPRIMIRLDIHGAKCDVFAGFRKGSAISLYFGSDPVYHFNNHGELRRAFVGGMIQKAQQRKVFEWQQSRSEAKVTVRSRSLTSAEQQTFGDQLFERVAQLRDAIRTSQFVTIGQFPDDGDAIVQLARWLGDFKEFKVAREANVS